MMIKLALGSHHHWLSSSTTNEGVVGCVNTKSVDDGSMPARMDPLVVFKTTHPPAITAEAEGDFPSASSLQMSLARSLAWRPVRLCKKATFCLSPHCLSLSLIYDCTPAITRGCCCMPIISPRFTSQIFTHKK